MSGSGLVKVMFMGRVKMELVGVMIRVRLK